MFGRWNEHNSNGAEGEVSVWAALLGFGPASEPQPRLQEIKTRLSESSLMEQRR